MLRRFGTALTNVSMHLQPRGCRPAQYTPTSRSQERCKAGHMFGVHGQPTSTERRSRTTTFIPVAAAHIGTYACARVLQACSALGGLGQGHAERCTPNHAFQLTVPSFPMPGACRT